MKKFLIITIISCSIFANSLCTNTIRPKTTEVKVGILATAADVNAHGSLVYYSFYGAAIYYAIGKYDSRLKQCGYHISILPVFFNGLNPISIAQSVKALQKNGTWILIGPRRSNINLLILRSMRHTPIVSTLANGEAIEKQKPPFFTMAPTITKLVKNTFPQLNRLHYGTRFGTFVDATCIACQDFANQFTQLAPKNYHQAFTIYGVGNHPNLKPLFKVIKQHHINFLLLPNYPLQSGNIIRAIHKKFKNIRFVGSVQWGVGPFSLLGELPHSVQAIAIRPAAPHDMHTYSLLQYWNTQKTQVPQISYYLIHIIKVLTQDLCKQRPKDKFQYTKFLSKTNHNHFSFPDGFSVSTVQNGRMETTKQL